MRKATLKPVEVQYITFDDMVQHGLTQEGANIVNGFPWAFTFMGRAITHESESCFIIPTEKYSYLFHRDEVLVIYPNGQLMPYKVSLFERVYNTEGGDLQEPRKVKCHKCDSDVWYLPSEVEKFLTNRFIRCDGCGNIIPLQ